MSNNHRGIEVQESAENELITIWTLYKVALSVKRMDMHINTFIMKWQGLLIMTFTAAQYRNCCLGASPCFFYRTIQMWKTPCYFRTAPFIRTIHQGQAITGLLREETEHWRNYNWHSKAIGTQKYCRRNSDINTKIWKWLLQTMRKSVLESTKKIRKLW